MRIHQKRVTDNDQANFAPKGNIVASVRRGTGVLIMANAGVEVSENLLDGNATSNVMIVSYRERFTDPKCNPLPRRIAVHTDKQGRAGFAPPNS